MEFRVLGPLEVAGGAAPVPVGGPRERALLARLLLSVNQVVSSDALAEDLWSGAPPEGAGQALWVYVSRLRKALRAQGGEEVVITRPPGYLLRVEPEAVDSCRFEALVEQGRRLAANGDPAAAAATFREALALWRGPALADVADAPFAKAEAARLEEGRVAALEERIHADLACGRHGPLVGELAELTREHPLRERLWAQRMLALYRAGRQAEALRAYQDVRRYLGEELGIEPGEELRRLEVAILRHERGLDWSAAEQPDGRAAGVVSFLFTDIVGSTELFERMGDDAGDELRRRHFTALREAFAAHGGTEVKSPSDGLMAAFTSPLAALRCAVAIQRAVAEDNRSRAQELAVRVGLHAGEPIAEDDDSFGTPVVVAQRLCARARGGQILASSLVQGLVGNRSGCFFTPLGGLALTGLSEPVAACEVVWEDQPDTATLPLPLPLERESSTFVGRAEELRRLEASWDDARAGRRQLVLLAGEPGIGKTCLAAEFAKRTHPGGAAVLFGRCDEGMGVPYQPFVEALDVYLRHARTPALGRLAGELVRLVPEIPERVGDLPAPIHSDPEIERYRLFDAVAAWLSAVSAESPAVLVIDDLHWASRPTLSLLGHLLRSGEPLHLLVVATYRDTDVTAELTDALADLMRQPGIERIRLGGLDEAGVAAYMEARARHQLDDAGRALAATVHARTAGNPFFVGQVVRHLAETEAIVRREGRWTPEGPVSTLGIPEGVRDVIARRLARLPAETGDLLALASVLGDRFELDVLVRASGEPEVSTLRALDPAIAARLITEAGHVAVEYRFVHALVRATLYDGLPRSRQVEFHRRAAKAIEAAHGARLDDDLPALAHHYARAGSDERPSAIDYATRAGHRALAQRAHDEAVSWYRQALDLLATDGVTDEAQHCDLLTALGEAQRRAGDAAHRQTLLDAAHLAQQLGDATALARAALANSRGFYSETARVDTERISVLESALAACPEPTATRARLLITLASELSWAAGAPHQEALADEALAIARDLDDAATLGAVLPVRHSLVEPARTESERVAELTALADQLDDPALVFWAAWVQSHHALVFGDGTGFEHHLGRARHAASELGQPVFRWTVGWATVNQSRLAGRLALAEEQANEAMELGLAAGIPDSRRMHGANMFGVRYDTGRLVEFADLAGRRRVSHPQSSVLFALTFAELGRPDEARVFIEELDPDAFSAMPGCGRLYPLTQLAEACARVGDADRAAALYDRLTPRQGIVASNWLDTTGAVDHYLGLLAVTLKRHAAAADHFAAAAGLHEAFPAPTLLARTRLEWARMLLTRGQSADAAHARDLLGQALGTARELGLASIERQALELLQECR